MVTDKIKELEAAKVKMAALEKSIYAQLQAELSALPGKYGFADVQSFVAAVKAAAGNRKKGRSRGVKKSTGGAKRRKRAVITDATRASVKKMVAAGRTGTEIAKALQISLPSVQNIKKALGLVQARKK